MLRMPESASGTRYTSLSGRHNCLVCMKDFINLAQPVLYPLHLSAVQEDHGWPFQHDFRPRLLKLTYYKKSKRNSPGLFCDTFLLMAFIQVFSLKGQTLNMIL